VARTGAAGEIALHEVAAEVGHVLHLVRCFHPFRDCRHSECLAELHGDVEQRAGLAAVVAADHQRAVDLQRVGRQRG
jgi:hypothetical protein